jgi:hypothetical protein
VGRDGFAGVAEFFGDLEAGGAVGLPVRRLATADRRGLAGELLVAVVGVAMPEAMAGEAVLPGDPAGAEDVVVGVSSRNGKYRTLAGGTVRLRSLNSQYRRQIKRKPTLI